MKWELYLYYDLILKELILTLVLKTYIKTKKGLKWYINSIEEHS